MLKSPKKPGSLILQIDEMWSFVGSKANKQWIWLAIDAVSREIVGVYIGDRSAQAAKQLWRYALGVCAPRNRFHQYTASVQFATQTFGRHTNKSYQVNVIVQSVKIAVRRVISNDSIIPLGNELHA